MKKISVEKWTLHKFNPDVIGERVAEVYYEYNDFKINITSLTVQEEEIGTAIKYICEYYNGNKRYIDHVYDTYYGNDKDKIKIGLKGCIEFCYNKHRKGRNVKLF